MHRMVYVVLPYPEFNILNDWQIYAEVKKYI